MRAQLRRHRAGVLVGVVVAVAIGAVALLGGRAESGDPLDPDNPGRSGAQALARVLDDRGVSVRVARGADAMDEAAVDGHTTVVVTNPEMLGRSTIDRMMSHAGAGVVVLVGPDARLVDDLGLDDRPRTVHPDAPLEAGCADYPVAGLRLDVDHATAYAGEGCFTTGGDGSVLVRPSRYGGHVLLFGAGSALADSQILRGDNAAVALRLLGENDRLVWYVADLDGSEGIGLGSLLPRWIGPGLWLALVTVVALAWWRGRRLGPLAREPLPVVVRAAETTEALGRLYRRAGDRAHAADVLRRATLDRLATALRLGTGARADEQVVRAAAERLARPVEEVGRLFDPVVPPDDRTLIALANDLAALEEEVRRP
jgi:hypothetical protein